MQFNDQGANHPLLGTASPPESRPLARKKEDDWMKRLLARSVLTIVYLASMQADATDRFFSDIDSYSQSKRYRVTAKSPDNQKRKGRVAFQSSFAYECTDTQTRQVLWTRKQTAGKPEVLSDDPKDMCTPSREGSPCSIYVADSGYTVIYTDWDDLIVVDSRGKETGKANILKDCMAKDENDKYVLQTTAGPMWAGRSHWFFVCVDSKEYFVIRPWWGRYLIIELSTCAIKTPTESLNKASKNAEKEYVLNVLKTVLDGTAKKCDCCGGSHEAVFAAYLAGVLKIQEAVPALRKLEGSTHSGSLTMGGFSDVPEGRIDPFNYSTYTTRQNVHLALRRLGVRPGAFPCTSFETEHRNYDQKKPYVRKQVPGTRESNADKVKKGMSPEQVIDLIGCPDYIPSREWQYDIDAEKPYTLTISWTDGRTVEDVKEVRPALWQEGTVRDRER